MRQRISRSAKKTRRLVPLARGASAPIYFSNRERSRTLFQQVFDNGMYLVR